MFELFYSIFEVLAKNFIQIKNKHAHFLNTNTFALENTKKNLFRAPLR